MALGFQKKVASRKWLCPWHNPAVGQPPASPIPSEKSTADTEASQSVAWDLFLDHGKVVPGKDPPMLPGGEGELASSISSCNQSRKPWRSVIIGSWPKPVVEM